MKILKIGKTVILGENAKDFGYFDELAYALATSMASQLEAYQKQKQDLKNSLQKTEQELADLGQQRKRLETERVPLIKELDEIRPEVEIRKKALELVEATRWKIFRWLYMLIWGRKWRQDHNAAVYALNEIERRFAKKEKEIDSINHPLTDLIDRTAQLTKTLDDLTKEVERLRKVPKMVQGIRRLDYLIVPLTTQKEKVDKRPGKVSLPRITVFIDPEGEAQSIEIPKINLPDDKIIEMEETTSKLMTTDILLDPGAEEGNKFGRLGKLYGSEETIAKATQLFSELIQTYSPERFDFSIIKKDTVLGKYLSSALNNIAALEQSETDVDHITRQQYRKLEAARERLKAVLEKHRVKQVDLYTVIERLEKEFQSGYRDFEEGRKQSRHVNEDYLKQSQYNSLLVRYHFFCPQCNALPEYLERFYEIQETDIDKFETAKIERGLRNFQEACFNTALGKKFDNKDREEIQDSWERAYRYLTEIERRFKSFEETSLSRDSGNTSSGSSQKQWRVNFRKLYKATVWGLLKNPLSLWKGKQKKDEVEISSKPLNILNPNTRLIYNPENRGGLWRCPVCETTYSKDNVIFGAVNKIRHDIIYPMVHTLWNHESIWSKKVDLLKDIAREIRGRQIEESNALQSPIDQFLADTRQIRLQLQQSKAKGEATYTRLNRISQEFKDAGLLDDNELLKIKDSARVPRERLDQVDTQIKEIDGKENEMQEIPQMVFEDRPLPPFPEEEIISKDVSKSLLPFKDIASYKGKQEASLESSEEQSKQE
jgi:hypothetical protein